jgi:peptide/nickel transport system permease protein
MTNRSAGNKTELIETGLTPPAGATATKVADFLKDANTEEARPVRRKLPRMGWPVILSLLILAVVVVAAILADLIAPLNSQQLTFLNKLKPPVWLPKGDPKFPLGTDASGHNILNYLIHGARTSLIVGIVAPTLSAVIGVTLGLIAGFRGKLVDAIIMRAVDIQIAFPSLVLALVLIAVLKPSMLALLLVLAISGWAAFARISRGEVLAISARDYVLAARATGVSEWRIAIRHILPNMFSSLIVFWTTLVAVVILAEAALSFLGLGLPAPAISWGGMLTDARNYLSTAWWIPFWPGLTLTLVIIAINTLGDWLRDALDPTTQR